MVQMIEEKQFTPGRIESDRVLTDLFVHVFQAYLECDAEIQVVIQEMSKIANSKDAAVEEREAALDTIREALFPHRDREGVLGVDMETLQDREDEQEKAKTLLDMQEMAFAEKVEKIMREKGITQQQLAERVGVGQPAISMMLSRKCRPQGRTIDKIAEVLGVSRDELWSIR